MADQENSFQPSKKRAAGREISRDNPGLDDDEETTEQETGTFKRASDEVIAARRIVKVRKHQSSAPSSNPFASIRLVPPTNPIAAASETSEKVESGKTVSEEVTEKSDVVKENPEVKDDDNKQTENKVETVEESVVDEKKLDAASEGSKPESTVEKVAEDESKKDPEVPKVDSEEKKDNGKETSVEGASFGSFHQLSSSQNAFTGVAGTGFSSSTFSFGSISKEGSPLGSGTTTPGSTFGQTAGFSFPPNGSSSIFATPGGVSVGSKADGTATPSMKEVAVETGEENEKAVFTADSVLFEYIDGGWKERGKGELKVNVSTETGKARLVMRARGNYRLILNASLFPDMKLANMDKRGITFACVNSTGEGKEGLSTFALKFKDGSIAQEFRAVVTEHKGEPNTASVKTPENSPKASDEQK